MKNNFYLNPMLMLIQRMHEQFKIQHSNEMPFTADERKFRITAMQEELDEYRDSESREEDLDSMVDLIVFALGTVERQGMLHVFEEAFNRVMKANCNKELGKNDKRGSFQLDLVKPEGWEAPDHSDLVYSPVERASMQIAKAFGILPDLVVNPRLETLLKEAKNITSYETASSSDDLEGIDATLNDRGSRYGRFEDNARITQELLDVLMTGNNSDNLTVEQREAYHMILHKMARSVCGDTEYLDNIHDIVGYATLLENQMKAAQE